MPLTSSQLSTLKNHILNDETLNAFPNNDDGAFSIAALLNASASPDYWVWRSSVSKNEFTQSVSADATTFSWTGNGFITRSQGERDAWREIFNATNTINPSLVNVRQAFQDIFSGSGDAAANRTHMLTVARRKAKRGEKLFSVAGSGPGNNGGNERGDTTNPDVLVFEGNITFQEVSTARNLP